MGKESKGRQQCKRQLRLQLSRNPHEDQLHISYTYVGCAFQPTHALWLVVYSVSPHGLRSVSSVSLLTVSLTPVAPLVLPPTGFRISNVSCNPLQKRVLPGASSIPATLDSNLSRTKKNSMSSQSITKCSATPIGVGTLLSMASQGVCL